MAVEVFKPHTMLMGCLVFRQLVLARDRIDTGLKKLLETNELVANMEVYNYNYAVLYKQL